MAYQLPQFIETEDRPIPFLTWRQLIYCIAAGMLTITSFYTFTFPIAFTIALISFTVALGFGFIKVSGRPLHLVFWSMLKYLWNPRKYYWRRYHSKTHEYEHS